MAVQVCSPWTTPDQLCCEGAGTTDDCQGTSSPLDFKWSDEEIILAASNMLHGMTGSLYPGECTAVVWPCIGRCVCHRAPCGACGTYEVIELPTDYDVLEVTSITEDGVALDASAYRLESPNRIVRLDGLRWSRTSMGLPGDEGVETVVTFTHGRIPPIELQMAAAELACELKKACNGDADCGLPPHVRAIARRGVQIELFDILKLMNDGKTGLPIVDHALVVHGVKGGIDTFVDPVKFARPRGYRVSP